ncbi:MAG TPA: hypothetical protein VFO76_11370, partial [Candidatus Kapabacteria bacterium]|nr:hypothetical protein [Candidatus Kapabacteria bacterium]
MCSVVTVLLILLSFFSEASSQWVKISSKAFPVIGSSGGMLHFKNGVLWGGYRSLRVSLDTGKTWVTKINSFPNINDFLMNIDFVDAQIGLVRTAGNNSAGNIFYTNDQGANWIAQTPPGLSGSRYTINAGPGIVISCARDGIYSSFNGGNSFIRTYSGATPNILTSRGNGVIAAFEAARVVVSTDFGQSWTVKPFDQTLQDSYSMEFDYCDTNRLYLANEDFFVKHNNVSEVIVSADRGGNWVSKNQQSLGVFSGAMAVTQNAAYFQTISSGLYRTTDGGNNWTNIPAPTSYPDSRMLVALTDNILVCVDQNGDVWRTDNSGGFPVSPQAIPLLTDPRALTIKSCSS